MPQGEIIEELIREGYSQEDIRQVFVPHNFDMRSWYFGFGIISAVIGLYSLVAGHGFLLLILSGTLFAAYFREVSRLKVPKNKE